MLVLLMLARLVAGGYFIWTASSKLGNTRTFWSQIMGYQIVGATSSRVLASVLPPLEFVAGLFFSAGLFPFITGPVLLVLLMVFTVAIVVSLVRKIDNDCGCTAGQAKVSPALVLRNAGLAALVVAGMFSTVPLYEGDILVAGVGVLLIVVITVTAFRNLGK